MNPKGETYASTGGDGGVTIRSAAAADFGRAAHHLSPGKGRFGISVSHVSFPLFPQSLGALTLV
jgi:WD repeat-containing protein 61